ncbi:cytochrome [Mycobacterium sp. CBMA 234]|uniref:cytochrome P450 n=1 Tax=Mycolicibacterium sp. CBMA 234 TaxID=1918495 RepID=UPI0012DE28D4|nr:cytochrome P450 [Mycolicibacterium sp. CBMA 234]MUL68392.1 cytochrome [Mycolicibacterium sp. CBMA 234]
MTTATGNPSVFDAGLPFIDYSGAQSPDEAQAIIRQAREQSPIAIGPYGPEVLTYDLAHAVLRDQRFRVPQGMYLAAQGITSGPVWDRVCSTIISIDGPEHTRLRQLVATAFNRRAIERLRTTVVDVVSDLVDRQVARGHCDVVTDIARQYPTPVICALLGAPAEDWAQLSAWVDDFMQAFDWHVAQHETAILTAWDALDAYIDDMVVRRRHTLTDDLISDLIRAEEDGDRLSADELRVLSTSLLAAGTDTTRNQVAGSVHVLCEHPEQWALLGAHPDLAGRAVEETMRHSPVAIGAVRMALEDVELAGITIPTGTFVLVNTAAANRDPAVYDDPDRLDITREGAPAMQTFGAGTHYCLGVHLAKMELAEALAHMTARMPNPRVTGPAPWKPLAGLSGPITLPIAFDRVDQSWRAAS